MVVGSITLVMTGPALDSCEARELGNWCGTTLLVPVIGIGLFFVGNRTLVSGRRVWALSWQVGTCSPPAVLYLRSFGDDATAGKGVSAWGPSWMTFAPFTEEEQLVNVLNELGPVTAIGKPGERLPQLGAQRLYVPDTAWRDTVSSLMETARLVVLRSGATAGVSWEAEHALQSVSLPRLVVLFPRDRRLYELFDRQIEPLLGRALPPWPLRKRRFRWLNPRYGEPSTPLMLRFESDGQPALASLDLRIVPFFRRGFTRTATAIFMVAFAPVFKSLGASTQRPPISWFMVVLMVLMVSILVGLAIISLIDLR